MRAFNNPTTQRQSGFTLIEILIALAIFAVMSLIAFRGLSTMVDTKIRLDAETTHWRDMTLVLGRFDDDVTQVLSRSWRDSGGVTQPPVEGNAQPDNPDWPLLQLVRANRDQEPIHVGYRLKDGRLEMMQWDSLDQAPRTVPQIHVMFDHVERFEVSFMDSATNWQSKWPVAGSADVLPRAVRIVIQQTGQGPVTRIFALP
ncbi:type II secretion system minor pseudopilin GspJ [Silvimonas amylolytica]|uniref:Type II secretion system protein J n=1 Tax=Silvimonas amylolytica TaxID=449663 RepID=A0ABQ2PQW5_9NEIS|nr:type II secretion system minor pseudopilin GspJ [Silvimonas amylolytica]GGP27576.1 type II secretion system protein J [Silvimonas amylolytica]